MDKVIEQSELLSVEELADMLISKDKGVSVSIEYIVNDANSRTVNGQKVVQKHVRVASFHINGNYQQKVRELSGNPDFVAQSPKGKTAITESILRSDKTGKLLLNGYFDLSHTSNIQVIQYYKNGKKITVKTLEKNDLFLDAHYTQKEKTTFKGIEKLKNITINLDNVYKISFNSGTPNLKTYYIY